jgi:hypothetical protein
MNRILKYYPVIILIIIISHISCRNISRELTGHWESISIENPSPIFSKTLPTYEKGEVLLTLSADGMFIWNNTKDKEIITGKYRFSENNLYLDSDKESFPTLKTEYKYKDNRLIITDDEFTFTFQKKENH